MATFFKDISDVHDLSNYRATLKKASAKWDGEQFISFSKFYLAEGNNTARLLVGQLSPALLKKARLMGKSVGAAVQRGVIKVDGDAVVFEVEEGTPQYKGVRDGLVAGGVDVAPVVRAGKELRLDTKEVGKQYVGEDKQMGWRAGRPEEVTSDRVTTRYYTEEERERRRLRVEGDRLIGPKIKGSTGYVMNPETGDLHTFGHDADGNPSAITVDGGKEIREHHSSPLAGGKVAAAGHISLKGTFIQRLDDSSGHYKPTTKMTYKAMQEMVRKGFKLTDITLIDLDTGLPAVQHQRVLGDFEAVSEDVRQADVALARLRTILEQIEDEGADPASFEELKGHLDDPEWYLESEIDELEEHRKDLKARRKRLQQEVESLPKIQVAPSLRETTVVLQGKQGLSDEELDLALGDVDALNKLIEEKFQIAVFFRKDTPMTTLRSKPYINILIGNATMLKLKASQFLQTQGNEQAARVKSKAEAMIRRMGEAIKPSQVRRLEEKLAEVDKLGGEQALEELGLPPEEMDVFFQEQVLRGEITRKKAMKIIYEKLGGDDAMETLELDPYYVSRSTCVRILSGRIPPEEWLKEWRLPDQDVEENRAARIKIREDRAKERERAKRRARGLPEDTGTPERQDTRVPEDEDELDWDDSDLDPDTDEEPIFDDPLLRSESYKLPPEEDNEDGDKGEEHDKGDKDDEDGWGDLGSEERAPSDKGKVVIPSTYDTPPSSYSGDEKVVIPSTYDAPTTSSYTSTSYTPKN